MKVRADDHTYDKCRVHPMIKEIYTLLNDVDLSGSDESL